jgi:hypothetical protein
MSELLSRADLFNIGRRYVITRATRINPREVDVEGSDINLFIGAASYMANAVARQNIERINALLLDGAVKDDLDRYAFDRYQMIRKGASAALGTVEFTRASSTGGAGSIALGTKLITLAGIEYVTTTTANFTAFGSSAFAATANVRAAQAGKDFQVGANNIRRFDKPTLIFDPTITVNNSEPTSGGEPAEHDDVFRERVRGFWLAARRGTVGAIEFGALLTLGVESANAIEVLDDNRPDRFVELFIADSSGVASQALAAQVNQTLLEYRPAGIYVNINTSRPRIINVTFQPTFVAGVDTVGLGEQIRNALVQYVNSLRVNEPLLVNDLGAVFSRFRKDGLIPTQTSLIEPSGDLIPEPSTTLRTRPANVRVLTPVVGVVQ